MIIHPFDQTPSLFSEFVAQLRSVDIQQDRMRFRKNLERIGELLSYEMSKTLPYQVQRITTPLGEKDIPLIQDKIVVCSILRAGLALHQGILNYFDKADNAFISAYRKHTSPSEFEILVEYLASPSLQDNILILADPMLATGGSMELGYKAFLTKGTPKQIHVCCVIASPEGIEHIKKTFPNEKTTIWCAAIDPGMNEHKYIVPGFGDAGDLCYGGKL